MNNCKNCQELTENKEFCSKECVGPYSSRMRGLTNAWPIDCCEYCRKVFTRVKLKDNGKKQFDRKKDFAISLVPLLSITIKKLTILSLLQRTLMQK